MKEARKWFITLSVAVWGTQASQATVLDFNHPNNNAPYAFYDTNNYGDNVFATPQNGFQYGTNYGFTPDVTLSVDNVGNLFVVANSTVWITNISPPRSVLGLYGTSATNAMTFTITPHPAWSVTLRSFYAGVYGGGGTPNPNEGFTWLAAYLDGSATPAWTATASQLTNFPAGGRFFQEGVTPGWTSGLLTGANTVRLEWVPNVSGGEVALGNIGFSEVPEPQSLLLLFMAALISLLRRR